MVAPVFRLGSVGKLVFSGKPLEAILC